MDKLLAIDVTDFNKESALLELDRLSLEIAHLKADKTIKTFSSFSDLGLPTTATVMDVFNAMPKNSYFTAELTRDYVNICPKFFVTQAIVSPCMLEINKTTIRTEVRIITEVGVLHGYIHGNARNFTGFRNLLSVVGAMYVSNGDVQLISDFNYAGNYYLPRTLTTAMTDFPSSWDCLLKIERYSTTHFVYTVTELATDVKQFVKIITPTITSGWVPK